LHCSTRIATPHINKEYLDAVDRLIPEVDVLFGIMGEYWWDQWPSSPYAHWLPKMARLDMAVDTLHFPRVKTCFNAAGKRGFLYIGRNDPMKGTHLLSRLAHAMPEFRFAWIGHGPEIESIPRLSPSRPLTADFMAKVANDYDFFISPSLADPNPTTILESMAWGFPVVCTPQSGYYETSFRRNIHPEDPDGCVSVLHKLQSAGDNELRTMADEAREVVERDYTWGAFADTILASLGLQNTVVSA
jgi:glycosyltransferase involved in cell wall biosynthesis